jgi:hypothetical protein
MRRDWLLIGLRLYIFPPFKQEDTEGLRDWKPVRMSRWVSLKFRFKIRYWKYILPSPGLGQAPDEQIEE